MLEEQDLQNQQDQQLEEAYERLFPKMGRDFVYVEDLKAFLDALIPLLGPLGLILPPLDRSKARSQAAAYKEAILDGEVDPSKYDDLVNIESDDEVEVEAE